MSLNTFYYQKDMNRDVLFLNTYNKAISEKIEGKFCP